MPTAARAIVPLYSNRCASGTLRSVVILAAGPMWDAAQASEYQGLNASFVPVGVMKYEIAGESFPAHLAGGLTVGYRLRVTKIERPITVTPHLSIMATKFGGISLNTSQIAFSRVDYGVQLAGSVAGVRPYVTYRKGKATVERMVGTITQPRPDTVDANFWGSGNAVGAGIEIPAWWHSRCASSFDLSMSRSSGTFDQVETRQTPVTTGQSYRATVFALGWSGRFRGTLLLFACD